MKKNPIYNYMKMDKTAQELENQYFCYILYFPNVNLRYIGLSIAKNRSPDDLLKSYKTSSPKVKALLKDNELVMIEEIIKFETVNDAIEYEHQIAKTVVKNPNWINTHSAKYPNPSTGKYYPRYPKPKLGVYWKMI